jgi:proline iminopeptidase
MSPGHFVSRAKRARDSPREQPFHSCVGSLRMGKARRPRIAKARRSTDLHYYGGYGDPRHQPVVFLHGGPGSNSWAFAQSSGQKLADMGNYYVVPYDQRGGGLSPRRADFTFSEFTQDLLDLIASLGLQSPILVGNSFGGFVSLKFLERFGGVAKGLVMVGTPLDFPESFFTILEHAHEYYEHSYRWDLSRKVKQLQSKMFPHGLRPPFNFTKKQIKDLFEHVSIGKLDYSPSDILFRNIEFAKLMPHLVLLQNSRLLVDFNDAARDGFHDNESGLLTGTHIRMLERLSSRLPIHAIFGAQDRLFSSRQVGEIETIVGKKGKNRFSRVADAGHYPFLEQNLAFVTVLTRHLKSF